MYNTPDLKILFVTNFSDACFRTGRAIAQLADTCTVDLTVAYVAKPGAGAGKQKELNSFLAELDDYDSCYRVITEASEPLEGILGLCERNSFDLIVAPASDQLGVQSLFTQSLRARILKRSDTPLWTMGSHANHAGFKHAIRTVACLVDLKEGADPNLPLAVAFASQIGARLHILHVIPTVHEGMLAGAMDSVEPLAPAAALERIQSAFAGYACPDIEIAIGDVTKELPRLLNRCEADVAFIGSGQALTWNWAPRLSRAIDKLPCPVICLGGGSGQFKLWSFQTAAATADELRATGRSIDRMIAS